MRSLSPSYCRTRAFETFQSALPEIESLDGLVTAAIAVAMHELEDTDIDAVHQQLDEWVDKIRWRVSSDDPRALLAHAHEYLFDELELRGNEEDYYNPHNSYLPVVVENLVGLPITVSLIYRVILGRLGITAFGVNAPMHFLVEVSLDSGPMLVDPFCRGRVLTRSEVGERIEQTGRQLPAGSDFLPRASHRAWIQRLLRNLHGVFLAQHRPNDVSAMLELNRLLAPTS